MSTSDELKSVGKRRARLLAGLALSESELRLLIVRGHSEGLPIAVMCRLGGVSRMSAHRWLRESRSEAMVSSVPVRREEDWYDDDTV